MSKMWRFFYFGSFTVTKPDKIDFQWFWGKTTIGNNGFRWLCTIGPTMEWLCTIVEVYQVWSQ